MAIYPSTLKQPIFGVASMCLILGENSSKKVSYSRRFYQKYTSYLLALISTSSPRLGILLQCANFFSMYKVMLAFAGMTMILFFISSSGCFIFAIPLKPYQLNLKAFDHGTK